MTSGFSTDELLYPLTKGDKPNHEFHGNQYQKGWANQELAKGADDYAKKFGIRRQPLDYSKIVVNPARAKEIADAYMKLPSVDESARPAYRQFAKETHQQFEYLTKVLGVKVDVTKTDPYANAQEMAKDIQDNHHLSVLSADSTGGHPFVTNREIEEFRAVHDAFGHASTGREFDRHGEESAWASHSQMYSPLARLAMTTATRGQNSVMTQLGGGFPEQKASILPEEWSSLRDLAYSNGVAKSADAYFSSFFAGFFPILKGDFVGHPFRGNQYEKGEAFGKVSPTKFLKSFKEAFTNNPRSAYVNHYTFAEIKAGKMTPMLSRDGKTGVLIHDHGDGRIEATALFNSGNKSGSGLRLLKEAVDKYGVNYVECFGDFLKNTYGSVGFKVESTSPFDPQYAPSNWNYKAFGKPNYYTMRISQ